MNGINQDSLFRKLDRFPLFSQYLGPSLRERLDRTDWFENRFIRDIHLDASFVERYENLLKDAHINEVKNANLIFESLSGKNTDYDLELFDVFAEIRLICWARENDYTNIEKLSAGGGQTSDFSMDKLKVRILAEAKHFRARDYLLDFVYDRVGGLLVSTGQYKRIDLSVKTTPKYRDGRAELVKQTAKTRSEQIQRARAEITADLLEKMINTGTKQTNLLDGLISVEVIPGIGLSVVHSTGWQDPLETCNLMMDKLAGNLNKALVQIRCSMMNVRREDLRGIVFFSGTGPQEREWSAMWDTLFKYKEPSMRRKINDIRRQVHESIDIPFDLIVAFGNPPKYDYFPWPVD